MIDVSESQSCRVTEYADRFIKPDSVLREVAYILLIVPFKSEHVTGHLNGLTNDGTSPSRKRHHRGAKIEFRVFNLNEEGKS